MIDFGCLYVCACVVCLCVRLFGRVAVFVGWVVCCVLACVLAWLFVCLFGVACVMACVCCLLACSCACVCWMFVLCDWVFGLRRLFGCLIACLIDYIA